MQVFPLRRILSLLSLPLLSIALLGAGQQAPPRPNFIVIFCDDLGYADIGPFGSTQHRTPNLDRMASEGRKFTHFYSTSGVCSPSRASLMTGCYPRRIGLHENETGSWVLFPGNSRGLAEEEVTMAEVLKDAGYATAIVGKWHLGDQPEFLPTRHGFDSWFGIPYSNDMGHTDRDEPYKYPPLPLMRDEEVIETEPDQREITKRYTEESIRFIEENKDGPFFLYLPHTMPHWPQYSSEAFAGKSANGPWGDTVEEIDWSTGEILKTLERLGIDENTFVVFTSDNGGATRHGASNAPLSGGKGSTMEGGQRIPCIVRWPAEIPAGTTCAELATTMDLLPTFAALAGAEFHPNGKIDGHDIRSLLAGEEDAISPYHAFYYYFRGQLQAVRCGDWKLRLPHVPMRGKNPKKVPAALYDVVSDSAESENRFAEYPALVEELTRQAAIARQTIGDDRPEKMGSGQRKPGEVSNPEPLTE